MGKEQTRTLTIRLNASETKQLASVLDQTGIVCLQAKVHQSHLSVLYFKPS